MILDRIIERLACLCEEIILVTNKPESHGKEALSHDKQVKVVQDKVPHQGPLGGILAGLVASTSLHSLVVACDMPFLNVELLKYLMSMAGPTGGGVDVVIAESPEGPEPLHAVYSKNCISPIEKRLAEGDFRIISFFDEVKVKRVGKDEVTKLDPHLLSFFNINTLEDLAYARKMCSDFSSHRG
jgi:molybdopterin-guanine dinucleotide biosynthesis protein A